jgi:hypothetical protein
VSPQFAVIGKFAQILGVPDASLQQATEGLQAVTVNMPINALLGMIHNEDTGKDTPGAEKREQRDDSRREHGSGPKAMGSRCCGAG